MHSRLWILYTSIVATSARTQSRRSLIGTTIEDRLDAIAQEGGKDDLIGGETSSYEGLENDGKMVGDEGDYFAEYLRKNGVGDLESIDHVGDNSDISQTSEFDESSILEKEKEGPTPGESLVGTSEILPESYSHMYERSFERWLIFSPDGVLRDRGESLGNVKVSWPLLESDSESEVDFTSTENRVKEASKFRGLQTKYYTMTQTEYYTAEMSRLDSQNALQLKWDEFAVLCRNKFKLGLKAPQVDKFEIYLESMKWPFVIGVVCVLFLIAGLVAFTWSGMKGAGLQNEIETAVATTSPAAFKLEICKEMMSISDAIEGAAEAQYGVKEWNKMFTSFQPLYQSAQDDAINQVLLNITRINIDPWPSQFNTTLETDDSLFQSLMIPLLQHSISSHHNIVLESEMSKSLSHNRDSEGWDLKEFNQVREVYLHRMGIPSGCLKQVRENGRSKERLTELRKVKILVDNKLTVATQTYFSLRDDATKAKLPVRDP